MVGDADKRGLRPIVWVTLIGGALALVSVVLLVLSAMTGFEHTCEVCIDFRGREQCRSASGSSAEEATQTATGNACAVVGARGMTLSIECQNTPPVRVTCEP